MKTRLIRELKKDVANRRLVFYWNTYNGSFISSLMIANPQPRIIKTRKRIEIPALGNSQEAEAVLHPGRFNFPPRACKSRPPISKQKYADLIHSSSFCEGTAQ